MLGWLYGLSPCIDSIIRSLVSDSSMIFEAKYVEYCNRTTNYEDQPRNQSVRILKLEVLSKLETELETN